MLRSHIQIKPCVLMAGRDRAQVAPSAHLMFGRVRRVPALLVDWSLKSGSIGLIQRFSRSAAPDNAWELTPTLAHIVLDDRVAAFEIMPCAQPIKNPLRGMALLARHPRSPSSQPSITSVKPSSFGRVIGFSRR